MEMGRTCGKNDRQLGTWFHNMETNNWKVKAGKAQEVTLWRSEKQHGTHWMYVAKDRKMADTGRDLHPAMKWQRRCVQGIKVKSWHCIIITHNMSFLLQHTSSIWVLFIDTWTLAENLGMTVAGCRTQCLRWQYRWVLADFGLKLDLSGRC